MRYPIIMLFNNAARRAGFTILEIMIVVIIVGVLASLALPKFFSMVEFSRAQEALSAMAVMRGGAERYYVSKGQSYGGLSEGNTDTKNPLEGQPNAHFVITMRQLGAGYQIYARRNTIDGGDTASSITLIQTATTVTRSGTTAFAGIN